MSNNIKAAIDSGLDGLYVTQRDIDAVMRRVREESAPAKRPPVRFAAVIAAAMVMLMLGAAWTVSRRIGGPGMQPLSGPQAEMGQRISEEEAIDLAEGFLHEKEGDHIDLRDEAAYRISCAWQEPDLTSAAGYYRVTFAALTIEGTDYTVDVLGYAGAGDPILHWTRQRGVGEGHTTQEIRVGFSRVYGPDMLAWDWQVLNAYVDALHHADPASRSWEDSLMRKVTYLDPDTAVWKPEQVSKPADLERWAPTSVKLVSYEGKQSLLYYLPEVLTEGEGIHWAVVAEWDVEKQALSVSRRYDVDNTLGCRALLPNAVYEDHLQDNIGDMFASVDRELMFDLAARHIRTTYDGAPDVTDPARYTLTLTGTPSYFSVFEDVEVLCTPTGSEDPTYFVHIDFCGDILDSGVFRTANDLDSLRREILTDRFAVIEELQSLQTALRMRGDFTDPVALALEDTIYTHTFYADTAYAAVSETLGTRRMSVSNASFAIIKNGRTIFKSAYYTDRGNFLVEYDCEGDKVISVIEIPRTGCPWYAFYLLQADMTALGIAPEPYTAPVPDSSAAVDLPVKPVRGLRLEYLNDAFFRMYGPNMLTWTQEQLRTYQQYAILAEGADGDMGILCLRKTTYPDVPHNAISREKAADLARAALAQPDAVMEGAVLIGTPSADPVWKVALQCTNGDFWFVEVDCISGDVLTPWQWRGGAVSTFPYYDGETTPEYWFREIVLEQTIRECEQVWDRKSNG